MIIDYLSIKVIKMPLQNHFRKLTSYDKVQTKACWHF